MNKYNISNQRYKCWSQFEKQRDDYYQSFFVLNFFENAGKI